MGLFLEPEQLKDLRHMLSAVPPLWRPEQFYYYDRFSDGDPYQDERYRHCFRILLQAQKNRQYVDIDYISPNGNRLHHQYVPARLEYSVKNDKFRLKIRLILCGLQPTLYWPNSTLRHRWKVPWATPSSRAAARSDSSPRFQAAITLP